MSMREATGHNIVFIVGCQRSGTSWVQELLASHPRVRSGQESFLFVRYLGPQIRAWRGELADSASGRGGDGLQCYFTDKEFRSILQAYMLTLMRPLTGSLKLGEIFVEKTPDHALFIDEIHEVLPEARFVHVLRDTRDVASSMIAASKSWAKDWAPRTGRRAAKWWMKRVLAVKNSSKKLSSDQFFELRYENLRKTPEVYMRNLLNFLGLEWSDEALTNAIKRNDSAVTDKTGTKIPVGGEFSLRSGDIIVKHSTGFIRKAKSGSWKQDLTSRQKLEIWLTARQAMSELGYDWKYPW